MKKLTKTVEKLIVAVGTTTRDIEEGKCGIPSKCMERVAITRALRKADPGEVNHKVRVDGGVIKFIYRGHRYQAITPPKVKRALIKFDKERKAREAAERKGLPFVSKVEPHEYELTAERYGNKVEKNTPAMLAKKRESRKKARASGKREKRGDRLHRRVTGLGGV